MTQSDGSELQIIDTEGGEALVDQLADFVGACFDIRPDWLIHRAIPPCENHLGMVLAHQDTVRDNPNDSQDDS